MSIEVSGLSKRFGATTVLDNIDLSVGEGEFVALLGPSGSGKTTLLRIIAGLEKAQRGNLTINGAEALHLPARERRIGFVFQHYALFRHMTVFDNVAFGLNVRRGKDRPSRAVIRQRVLELLDLVQLNGLHDRFPPQLSGGQRQRVALARALAVEPRVLLLDEPFGALDAKVRADLRDWLRELHHRLGITTVFVTHDQDEALGLADRLAILNRGRIEQIGSPAEVYDNPASPFVVEFLGPINKLQDEGGAVAYVRPHEIIVRQPENGGDATVDALAINGPRIRVLLRYEGRPLEAEVTREDADALALAPGVPVSLSFKKKRTYPTATG